MAKRPVPKYNYKGQHPSLQIFFELVLRYNISVDQLSRFRMAVLPASAAERKRG